MSDIEPSNGPASTAQRVYRYFIVFQYAQGENTGTGNAIIERQVPLTEAGGPEGLVALQTDLARQMGVQNVLLTGLTVLPHEKPAVIIASAVPNVLAR